MLLGIGRVRVCWPQNFVLLRIQGSQMQSAGQIDATDIEEMPAVGQKPGKTMRGSVGWPFQYRDGLCCAARGGDALERRPVRGCEDNHSFLAPASASAVGCICQGQRRPAREIHALEFSAREEADEAAVRGQK